MKIVEWNEYQELLKELYEKIRLSEFDDIIAIGRGGSIIGAYLSSKLGIPTFYPIFLRHVGEGKDRRIEDSHPDKRKYIKSITGRLLLVDDYLREGLAMEYVLNLISKRATVKTLVMFSHTESKFKADYVGKYTEETNIIFPYDIL